MSVVRIVILGDHKVGKSVKKYTETFALVCTIAKKLRGDLPLGDPMCQLRITNQKPEDAHKEGRAVSDSLLKSQSPLAVIFPRYCKTVAFSSSVTVRFLTKRFIGEYSSDIDLLYRSSIRQEDVIIDVEVLDTCTRPGQSVHVDETRINWADAFVVVYSILNRSSFHTARALIETINRLRTSAYIPMMLLGNKTDLDHRREVKVEEGHQVALEHGCQYFEVSAAENIVGISLAFQAFLREARIVQHQKSTLMKRRKSSLANMSKRLGAMFGKNKDSGGSGGGGGESSVGRRGSIDVKDLMKT